MVICYLFPSTPTPPSFDCVKPAFPTLFSRVPLLEPRLAPSIPWSFFLHIAWCPCPQSVSPPSLVPQLVQRTIPFFDFALFPHPRPRPRLCFFHSPPGNVLRFKKRSFPLCFPPLSNVFSMQDPQARATLSFCFFRFPLPFELHPPWFFPPDGRCALTPPCRFFIFLSHAFSRAQNPHSPFYT